MCKNYITCTEIWVDKVYEIIAEVKGRDPKITCETVGIYRAPNEDMWLLENLADRTGYMGRTTQPTIIGGDLSLAYAEWNGHTEMSRRSQVFLNRLVWENGYTQAVNSPTRGDALLDVYLVRPESAFTSLVVFRGSVTIAGGTTRSRMGRKLP